MNIESLISVLTAAKFDVHFGEAPDDTECPYIVITNVTHPNFAADNSTFTKTTSLRLVLVESENHDWNLIQSLENTLDSIPLPYSEEDINVPSEHVCETYFDLTFLGGNKNG